MSHRRMCSVWVRKLTILPLEFARGGLQQMVWVCWDLSWFHAPKGRSVFVWVHVSEREEKREYACGRERTREKREEERERDRERERKWESWYACACVCVCVSVCEREQVMCLIEFGYPMIFRQCILMCALTVVCMRWLRLVGSLNYRSLLQKSPIKERIFWKETYDFKEPTNRSHRIRLYWNVLHVLIESYHTCAFSHISI